MGRKRCQFLAFTVAILAMFLAFASSCNTPPLYADLSESVSTTSQSVGSYEMEVGFHELLSPNLLVSASDRRVENTTHETLIFYELDTNTRTDYSLTWLDTCGRTRNIRAVSSTQNGTLIITQSCGSNSAIQQPPQRFLSAWDMETQVQTYIGPVPDGQPAGRVAWLPDEQIAFFTDILYPRFRIQVRDFSTNTSTYLPGFWESYKPALSPDGRLLAFFAQNLDPEAGPSITATPDMVRPDLIRATPHLYTWDLETGEVRLVLLSVENPRYFPAWSPAGDYIVFTGEKFRVNGVWAVEVATGDLSLLWHEPDRVGWVPGSAEMYRVVEDETTNEITIYFFSDPLVAASSLGE